MPLVPKAIRVKTSSGWQDIAIVGPQGPTGPVGAQGVAGPPAYWVDPNAPPSTSYLWVDTDAPSPPWKPPTLVDVIPVSGLYDGQEIYFQNAAMATDGLLWHLRYRSGAGGFYKWEFLGGASWLAQSAGDAAQASAAYADFTTPGPSLTAPLSGVYDIDFAAFIGGTLATYYWMTPKLGAAAPVDADAIQVWGDAGSEAHTYHRSIRRTLAANDVVKLQYKVGGGNCGYSGRCLWLRPVRVGP